MVDLILKYFPELSPRQISQFSELDHLYREWNSKVNVISRKDIDNLYLKHILHSLSIAKLIRFKPGTRILDIGTGGGFPGIPLAIMFPSCHFCLNDSILKKLKVVKEIALSTGLKNVATLNCRAEMISEQYDFIISRAVTNLSLFYSWTKDRILPCHHNSLKNGIIYLKGGDISSEIQNLKREFRIYPIRNYFSEDFFLTKILIYFPSD
jgi:16S rRNA (guanine527-N7)-methyltransferase